MNFTHEFDDTPPQGGSDPGLATRRARYVDALRLMEARHHEYTGHLETRQRIAEEGRSRLLGGFDARQEERRREGAAAKSALELAKRDLDAAHHAAAEHCAEIGVRYVPGMTTEKDVLAVPLMDDAEAARRLGLPFGVGFSDRAVRFLKPLLTLLCMVMASLSLGLGFRLLNPKAIFANPAMVALSLVMGGMVAVGLLVGLTSMWKPIGFKVGVGRPTREVMGLLVPFALITLVLFAGMAYLDASAMVMLNAARAALNPALGVPLGLALLVGGVLSGVYVVGLAATSAMAGYNQGSRSAIDGHARTDETTRREAAKAKVPTRAALDALANVRVVETRIASLDADLRRLEEASRLDEKETIAALPPVPTAFEAEEDADLKTLAERMQSAKSHYDAHTTSRSAELR